MGDVPERAPISGGAMGLLVVGGLAVAGGGIGAVVAKDAAEKDAFGDELFNSMIGLGVTDVAPDYTGMWISLAIVGLGVIALIAGVAVRSVTQPSLTEKTAPPESGDSSGAA